MNKWLINGAADDRISVVDRGFTYGDGLFETIAVRDGKARFIEAHLDRLQDGAERLGLPVIERDVLITEVTGLLRGSDHGTLKIILTRGAGHRGYAPPEELHPLRILGLLAGTRTARENYRHGVAIRHCTTPIGPSPATAGLKTLGRLEQVLARAEWTDVKIAEGLMSTADGRVICGTMSNLFLVQDGALITPDLGTCGINGIMRKIVLDQAEKIGLPWRIVDVSCDALDAVDELFLTNSLIGLWPIRQVAGKVHAAPGPITRRLMKALAGAGVIECAI